MHVLQNRRVWDDPISLTHERIRHAIISIIFEQVINRFSKLVQCDFLTDILGLIYLRFPLKKVWMGYND